MRRLFATAVPVLVVLLALIGAGVAAPVGAQWPPEVKNLKVLPEDTEFRELMVTMRGFTSALGVRCQHCHMGEEGQRLSEFDFASDEREAKNKARTMWEMTRTINEEFLTRFGDQRAGVEVRCVTCHRGTQHPEMIERIVQAKLDEEGLDAAAARYRELREEHYGGHSYDFGAGPLNKLSEEVGLSGRLEEAVGLLELNLEFNPDSSWSYSLLGEARLRQDDMAAARGAFEKALEIEPENSHARGKLEEIEAAEASEESEGSTE